MTKLTKAEADVELGGLTALVKARAGMVLDECARCAVLLFGGNGLTKSGQGELVDSRFLVFRTLTPGPLLTPARDIQRSPGYSNTRWFQRCDA